jgi:hypothetical protein
MTGEGCSKGWQVVVSLRTACSNEDYCSPVLCRHRLCTKSIEPLPFFSHLLRLARGALSGGDNDTIL